jgi:L-fuconolactonase
MRIDAHTHFWRYSGDEYAWIDDSMLALRRDFMPDDLEPELTRTRFDGCIAVQARQSIQETTWLLELAEHHDFIRGVVGWIDLQAPDVRRQLDDLERHPKLVGLRHVVQSEPDDFLLRPDFCRGITQLEEFGLAYDILIHPRQLTVAAAFARRFEGQRLVLDHLAKPPVRKGEVEAWGRDLRELASCPNVMCKLSGLVTEANWNAWTPEQLWPYLDVAFECFGAARLMIGSDWPVCTLAGDYSRTLAVVTDYLKGHSADEQDAVLGLNAQRFWKLDRQEQTP